jgi:hypothetical protein
VERPTGGDFQWTGNIRLSNPRRNAMSSKRERNEPRERRSPTATVSNYTDDFMEDLGLPTLPGKIPKRLEEALRTRIKALFFRLREARKEKYIQPIEIRLVRDTMQAVLTAHELGLSDSEALYAKFRRLVEALGYVSTQVGFAKPKG